MSQQLAVDEYRCAVCGGVFTKGWSDEEAKAEAATLFQQQPETHDMAVVCDDCFKQMTAAVPVRPRVS